MTGTGLFKLCGCRDDTGRRLGARCPRLAERRHGRWHFRCSTRDLWGKREVLRRGGFASKAAARRARDEVLSQSREERTGQTWTTARWLRYWLTGRRSIRPTTLRVYTQHVEAYLIPAVGTVRLAELTSRQLTAVFAEIAAGRTPGGKPRSGATVHRIRATLRAALNAAIRDGLTADNPARRIELPTARRPHPVVWTDARVGRWHQDGARPPVAVWTSSHLACFLDHVANDRLFALWWLIALRGLRAVRLPGCAGATSTSTGDVCRSSASGPRAATGWSRVRRSRRPAAATLRSIGAPSPCYGRTSAGNAPSALVPGIRGGRMATCSHGRMAPRCTRTR